MRGGDCPKDNGLESHLGKTVIDDVSTCLAVICNQLLFALNFTHLFKNNTVTMIFVFACLPVIVLHKDAASDQSFFTYCDKILYLSKFGHTE